MLDDLEWLEDQVAGLTTELEVIKPSEWAERKRYLPQSLTAFPGRFSFDRTPYLREIVDCMSVDSPVREVALMKSAQIGATTGILENVIGYFIEHVKTAPMMLTTADSDLAKLRGDSNITPMLELSGLSHLIRSADEKNKRKTGKTTTKIEWVGGGFMTLFGAQNANKFRSVTGRVLLNDEIDTWPLDIGGEGSAHALIRRRAATFEASRKVLDLSTPTIKGISAIEAAFGRGDQRYYHVRCIRCGFPQVLQWRGVNEKTGEFFGISWETDGGHLVRESVRYLCANCGHGHVNEDKVKLLDDRTHGAHWKPSARPAQPDIRSYHLSALYSPPGMQSWVACVEDWLEAWDEERNVPRDINRLKTHYNTIRGLPFEMRGRRVKFETISQHRRREYRRGEVPNQFARQHCGSAIHLLTCAVDIHASNLKAAVFGWATENRAFLVDYFTFEGSTEHIDDPNTWGRLRELIEGKVYTADDGQRYKIILTLIDSGYSSDIAYRFCGSYAGGVYPLKGRGTMAQSVAKKLVSEFKTEYGPGYTVLVDPYKDRWNVALSRYWDPSHRQPEVFFNAPVDVSDNELKELTNEKKVEVRDDRTGEVTGFKWDRPSGSANELWDLLVYNNAALDLVAWSVCARAKLKSVNWDYFWRACETSRPFNLNDRS